MKKPQNIIREACVDSLENALLAEDSGAERIELCSHLEADGLFPGKPLLEQAMSRLSIPVHVMVRAREGNFVYTPAEVEEMLRQVEICRSYGVAGVVFGLLQPDGHVDTENTLVLTESAGPMRVTFHKAIDESADLMISLRRLMNIPGITGVLTSGGKPTAMEGISQLREMVKNAGDALEIIVAGKVTRHNLDELHEKIGAREYHGKKIVND